MPGGDTLFFSCLNSSATDDDHCTCNISRVVLNIDLSVLIYSGVVKLHFITVKCSSVAVMISLENALNISV